MFFTALGEDALDDGLLEAVGGLHVGLARGDHVRVEEGLAQPDQRVRQGARLDDRDQAELFHVLAQQYLVEGYDAALHLAARVGEDAHGQGGFVVEEPAQAGRAGHHRVDVADGPGGMQLALGTFGLPALDGDLQHALGQPPQRLADQLLAAADAPEQGHPGHAELVRQPLHVHAPALVDPPGRGGHDAGGAVRGPGGARLRGGFGDGGFGGGGFGGGGFGGGGFGDGGFGDGGWAAPQGASLHVPTTLIRAGLSTTLSTLTRASGSG